VGGPYFLERLETNSALFYTMNAYNTRSGLEFVDKIARS